LTDETTDQREVNPTGSAYALQVTDLGVFFRFLRGPENYTEIGS